MGESRRERAGLISQLANLNPYPDSVPINNLVAIEGTPLEGTAPLDPFEFVRTIAVARITMPKAVVRLSAGREQLDDLATHRVGEGREDAHEPYLTLVFINGQVTHAVDRRLRYGSAHSSG